MANSLFEELNGNVQNAPNQGENFDAFIAQLNKFASTIKNMGSPHQMVQRLLNSRMMSQPCFNQYFSFARQFCQKMGLK